MRFILSVNSGRLFKMSAKSPSQEMRIGEFALKMSKNVFFLLNYHIDTSMLYCLKFSLTTCILSDVKEGNSSKL